MVHDFEACIEVENQSKKFNYDKMFIVFQKEVHDKQRLLRKLRDKNGVLKHQKRKLIKSVHEYLHHKEVGGIKKIIPLKKKLKKNVKKSSNCRLVVP